MSDRNPSAPSHVSKAQAARLTGMNPNRLRYLIKTKRVVIETHYGCKMIPMWSLAEFLSLHNPDDMG